MMNSTQQTENEFLTTKDIASDQKERLFSSNLFFFTPERQFYIVIRRINPFLLTSCSVLSPVMGSGRMFVNVRRVGLVILGHLSIEYSVWYISNHFIAHHSVIPCGWWLFWVPIYGCDKYMCREWCTMENLWTDHFIIYPRSYLPCTNFGAPNATHIKQ